VDEEMIYFFTLSRGELSSPPQSARGSWGYEGIQLEYSKNSLNTSGEAELDAPPVIPGKEVKKRERDLNNEPGRFIKNRRAMNPG